MSIGEVLSHGLLHGLSSSLRCRVQVLVHPQRTAWRNFPGVVPVHERNARTKAPASA